MPKFPFITDADRGDVPVNLYPAADQTQEVILTYTPGLVAHCALPNCSEVRGLHSWDGYLYAVASRGSYAVLFKVAPVGTVTELGSWASARSGKVWMASNSTQLVVVDTTYSGVYTAATGIFNEITDADFPGAGTCSYQDGYGLFTDPNSDEWFHSVLNNFTSFDSGDFYAKMAKSDGLTSVHSHLREPWLFGPSTTEVWLNAGGDNSSAQNPTFARNPGGVIPIGIGAAASSVGDESGLPMTWLSSYKTVVSASQYTPQEINNQMLSRAIRDMTVFSDAIAYGYKDSGHSFYVLTFPTADVTWVYDFTTQLWHKMSSWKAGGGYGRHRSNCYALLANQHYVGDYANGNIYKMGMDYLDDDGYLIKRTVHSQEQISATKRIFFPDVVLDLNNSGYLLTTGEYGNPWFRKPAISLYISNDGGHTWSSELIRYTGVAGDYDYRTVWRRVGSDYRRMYYLEMTDRHPWKISGIYW
jgi:hypothetical protein